MSEPVKLNYLSESNTQIEMQAEQNTVPRFKFVEEMNAKNRAYSFIIDSNLFHKFQEYCESLDDTQDPLDLCLKALEGKLL